MRDLTKNFSLCVCQWGHSRSVCLTRVLHEKGLQAVACGVSGSPDAVTHLSQAAGTIFLLQPQFIHHIPESERYKVVVLDVGPDRWVNPYNQELHGILKQMLLEQCGV